MIDLLQETLISIREVPKLLPRRGSGRLVHLSACYRWMDKGISGVRLEAVRIGGTTYTSREALQRFANRLSQTASHTADHMSTSNFPQRRAIESADEQARRIFAPRRQGARALERWPKSGSGASAADPRHSSPPERLAR